ncbi:MAG: putative toxin-antitoxin system toxin component, PIN family [Anaerolineae bacterium]|nr:putative toxin-antitoxin system toxin component, PIN family [Anaerolineae bacterium]MCI0611296.1 putative toxin-antitoxin system toxin component, PIN family [Anaerolineae bacterium]
MRFVFDTNVLISALLFEQSTPAQAFFAALKQGDVLLSAPLADEINRILYQTKFDRYITYEQREEFMIALVESSVLVEIAETISVCRDPKDNMILELAVSGKADAIVTGDSDLLELNPFHNITILNPRDFLTTYLSTNS